MKKNFFKKLALVLALVLTVTSLNYVPASAAATPAWKAKKSVISLMNRYAYGVKNVPSKGKVTWKTGNTKVAKVSQKGSLVAVGEGTTTLKATVKNKAGKTVKTLTQKVTVKAPVWTATKDTLKEGERTTFTKQYTAKGAKVKFASSNTEVAKVSQKGSVLAVKAGKTTITATFSMNGEEYATLTKDVTVEAVETAIQAVAQNTTTKLTATFVGETKDVKASEFKIVNANNVVVPVKSATVDTTDKTKVVLETYVEMKDGKEYTVTYTGKVESSAKFTATDGTVAALNVTPLTITAASATEIKVQTLDANNVIVGEYAYGKQPSEVEFTIDTNSGYTEGSKLYLYEVGNTAKAKVVYHTFKYDDKGVETGKLEKEFTITGVKDATTVSSFKYTISDKDKAPNWEKSFEAVTTLATNDDNKEVFFNITDSNKNDVTKNYKVSSADTTKILVSEETLESNKKGVKIVPVAEGTGYILVKNKDNVVVASLPVVVTAKKKATNLVLDTTSFTIGNGDKAVDANKKTVKATVKDQYGKDMKFDGNVSIDILSQPTDSKATVKKNSAHFTVSGSSITVDGSKFTSTEKGSYVVKVSATLDNVTVSRTFNFVVKDVANKTATSYKLIFDGVDSNNKVDLKVADDATLEKAQKTVKATVAGIYDGVVVSTVGDAKITFAKADGTKVDEKIVANDTIKLSVASNGAIVKNVTEGSYKVTAEFTTKDKDNKDVAQKLTSSFVVADTQPATTVSVKELSVEESTIEAALSSDKNVQFYYDGVKATLVSVSVAADQKKVMDKKVAVMKATVVIKINDNVNLQVEVPVNATFTLK
ncbi:Ig-like domain-containing protein [Velocimicrobium porci]|uniref:BIG2 domain-containing protein n=1 Tax=Velocimicrobium porci TaxID=2606634 RepID=A0A6L5Y042_9FIRM|nr:Ig-like domain-containing protein [Velocimicrobium porci]MSS64486.1 hypothetical protein [Velocimicrobium porci]